MERSERDRIKEVYDGYASSEERKARYAYLNSDVMMSAQEKERAIVKFLKRAGITQENVRHKKLIEIGAGSGGNLQRFLTYGFLPGNMTYNEIIDRDLAAVKKNLPDDLNYVMGDACYLDQKYNNYFDIVFISTVFSSILDETIRKNLANRVCNILKDGGGILVYDFVFDNPRNGNVKKVAFRRIQDYFGEGKYFKKKLTLAPPIARKMAKRSKGNNWYYFFNWPFFRTHLLTLIMK